jgi:hypothetical protein
MEEKMTIGLIRNFLIWCTAIDYGVVLVWFLVELETLAMLDSAKIESFEAAWVGAATVETAMFEAHRVGCVT